MTSCKTCLLDRLLEKGEPGIAGFIDTVADEHAGNNRLVTRDHHVGSDIVAVVKAKLQALSSTRPEGLPKSICNDFRDLLKYRTLQKLHTLVEKFAVLPGKERRANLSYLKHLALRVVRFAHPEDLDIRNQLEMGVNSAKRTRLLSPLAPTRS
jgi:hypothetical protein